MQRKDTWGKIEECSGSSKCQAKPEVIRFIGDLRGLKDFRVKELVVEA